MQKLILHAADVSNPFKPFPICRAWAYLVLEEFFCQGDREKQLGLTVQMLNDRNKVKKPLSQIGKFRCSMTEIKSRNRCRRSVSNDRNKVKKPLSQIGKYRRSTSRSTSRLERVEKGQVSRRLSLKPHSLSPLNSPGFIEFVVCPLYFCFATIMPPLAPCAENLINNLRQWEAEWLEEADPKEEEQIQVHQRIENLEATFQDSQTFDDSR